MVQGEWCGGCEGGSYFCFLSFRLRLGRQSIGDDRYSNNHLSALSKGWDGRGGWTCRKERGEYEGIPVTMAKKKKEKM